MRVFFNIVFFYFSFFILVPTALSATQLAYDQFSNWSHDGYSRDDGKRWKLQIDKGHNSSKTYSFGNSYANAQVTITFNARWWKNWENSGSGKDHFIVKINNTTVVDDSFSGNGNRDYSLDTTLDNQGKVTLLFRAQTTANNEHIYIDNVKIIGEPSLPIVNNADDICYLSPTTVGNKTTVQIRSTSTLKDAVIYYDTSSIFSIFGNFDDCSVDNGAIGDNCFYDSNGNSIGPVSMFNNGGWIFDLGTVSNQTPRSIHTYDSNSIFDFINDFFSQQGAIQASYVKDGKLYRGEVAICADDSSDTNTTTVYHEGESDFVLINPEDTQNIIGNTQIIGNTVECVTGVSNTTSSDYTNLSCENDLNKNDNNYITKYIDIDNNSTTKNSSSSTIKLPSTYKDIIWAGLYWQGHINNYSYQYSYRDNYGWWRKKISDDFLSKDIKQTNANKILIKFDNNSSYQTVYANRIDYSLRGSGNQQGAIYAAFADISSLFVNRHFTNDIIVTIANLNTTQGLEENLGNYGAWVLAVIYQEDENNPQSKLRNNSVYRGYKIVSSRSGQVDVILNDFLLPKHGVVDSSMSVFAGEGEYTYKPDTMELDGTTFGNPDTDNVFDARISNSVTRNPSLVNNNGIDIDTFNTSALMTAKRDANPDAESYNSTISLTSDWDLYIPSMVSFTTQLYKPRVCYYIDTIRDSQNNIIFQDKHFVAPITSGENYTFDLWISNMKKNVSDPDLEIARLVQVYLNMYNFSYVSNSTYIQNIGTSSYSYKSDSDDSDIAEYSNNAKRSTWRLGIGADGTQGGTLYPATSFDDNAKKAFIRIQGSLNTDENATNIDLTDFLEFKASFQTDSITIGSDNAQLISQCQDFNASGSVATPPAGVFNVVQQSFAATNTYDPDDPSDTNYQSYNALPTQISGRNFYVKILALDNDNKNFKNYTGDLNISIIPTPNYVDGDEEGNKLLCNIAVPLNIPQTVSFNNESQKDVLIHNISGAIQNASFKIAYDLSASTPKYVCSRDIFAIRPDRFILSAPTGEDIALLTSAQDYNLSVIATRYNSAFSTSGYNQSSVNDTNFDLNKTLYMPNGTVNNALKGTLTFGLNNIPVINGVGSNALAVKFDDVANVGIKLIDTTWAKVDLDNGDTPADCSNNGAYICGDINATFIPDHFQLTNVTLHNDHDGTFTYYSNDLNRSAHISLDITAQNKDNGPTQNFNISAWENPVNVTFTLPSSSLTENIDDINETKKLSFIGGATSIIWNETNNSKMLRFNFNRSVSNAQNPLNIQGSDVNVSVSSLYNGTTTTKLITNSSSATANVNFLYGRTHAPRQRFISDKQGKVQDDALIYYEVYCQGLGCDKSLLPNGINSITTDDPRWFVNKKHVPSTDGNVTSFTQKGPISTIKFSTPYQSGWITKLPIRYDGSRGYPYRVTIEQTPSSWLLFNKYNPTATKDEFEVGFISGNSNWAGESQTDTTTKNIGSHRTNRRLMW